MIAEVVPAAGDLATKADIAATSAELRLAISELRTEMHREFSAMKGLLVKAMVPVWLGVYGTLVTLIVLVIQR